MAFGSRHYPRRVGTSDLEHAPIGIYVIDAAFRIQQVNQFAAPVFRTVVPLLGRDFAEVVTELWGPDLGARVAQIFRRTLESGEKYVSSAFIELRHDTGTTLEQMQGLGWHSVHHPEHSHRVIE